MDTNNNQSSEPMTQRKLTEIFWTNFTHALAERNMTQRDFAKAANMNEKTLSSMISRKTCPDIWFMAISKEILQYDCTQMLYHYVERAFTRLLTEKERDVLNLIRTGDKNEQNRKLDVITAFLRYANESGNILSEAIPDATAPSMGAFENKPKRKQKHEAASEQVAQATPAPGITPQQKSYKKMTEKNPNQTYFNFFDTLGDESSDN